ncbi:uncharacterized protein HD556DRAFT_190416 [Suillus plorans]|uniref:Secreted protein n=1 Tax=Suillus plorans TaxID=116603 RepID=A0A9P7DMM0_9AGAM|nr:uncharacterized protein HD556DRAFT_190416 [Suillus plorans]KAG1798535.1 hypothetical protein HD556DRAFT_190416 [Suillus plorans]
MTVCVAVPIGWAWLCHGPLSAAFTDSIHVCHLECFKSKSQLAPKGLHKSSLARDFNHIGLLLALRVVSPRLWPVAAY